MNSLNLAGAAMMQSQQGSLIIAQAIRTSLNHGAGRVLGVLARLMTKVPGPHLLLTDPAEGPASRR